MNSFVSILVPVMDEAPTIIPLAEQVAAVMGAAANYKYEIIFIDDGSRDETWARISDAAAASAHVSGISMRRNFGKAAAIQQGLEVAAGDIVITMDGDLQDDPGEIPRFLAELEAGADLVSGWKMVRHDPLGKTLPSRLFNFVTAKVSGVKLHDFNCGFKAYRREVFEQIRLYGELHRFIPVLASADGYKVAEIVVQHHPREHGKSKYGVGRLFKGLLDLLTVITITRFGSRPGHLFGGVGLLIGAAGLAINLLLTVEWFNGVAIGNRPLLMLGVLLCIVGVQFVLFGMLAELFISHKPTTLPPAAIKRRTGGARKR
ncbi:MAG: glycosyltransferase family 2 protein [Xanthomonadales bacterium]|nr:glycosyltransferase family 2 protein [Xanthomonadales bacterium]